MKMSNEYSDYFHQQPDKYKSDDAGYVDGDPWANLAKPDPEPYKVQRISTDRSETDLNLTLTGLLNENAKNNYHPIKITPHIRGEHIWAYTVIFYYMPAGPSFTPPF